MSTNSGDRAVRTALHIARNDANVCRLHKRASNEFSRGMCMGQVIVADNYLGACPLLVMAAKNEIRFLYHYTEGRA